MNTWGLRSINTGTFNLKFHATYAYPKPARDVVITLLRIHNLTLNILGYMDPRIACISGCVRAVTGLLFVAVTLTVGDRNAKKGHLIQHWYDEALLTGVSQIARGMLEAFVPYGRVVNLAADVVATFPNLKADFNVVSGCTECMGGLNHSPHGDANYPIYFFPLYFA